MNSLQTVVEEYTKFSFYKVTNEQDETLMFVLPAESNLTDQLAFDVALDLSFVEDRDEHLEVEEMNQFDAKDEVENSELPVFDLETGKFLS